MAESPQERPGASKPLSDSKAGWLCRLLNRIVPEAPEGQGAENLPSSLAPLRQRHLINLKAFGILLVRCEESGGSAPAGEDVYDHPWSFLRIRLTGSAREKVLDSTMSLSDRKVTRFQVVRACDFVGRATSSDLAWVLLIRGAVSQRAGRLCSVMQGQAAYIEEVPWVENRSGRSSKIVVDE